MEFYDKLSIISTEYMEEIILGYLIALICVIAFMYFMLKAEWKHEDSTREYNEKIERLETEAKNSRIENNLKRLDVDEKILDSPYCTFKYNDKWYDNLRYMCDNDYLTFVRYYIIISKEAYETLPDDTMYRIPIKNIKFYTKNGDITYSNYIVNSGKDFSLSGAVTGALIGGGVGAVIGSMKDTNKTETKVKTNDQRQLNMYYEENGEIKCLSASYDSAENLYKSLHSVIPEKDYEYIQSQAIIQDQTEAARNQQNSNEPNTSDRLKQLNELHDSGLITDEEYKQKRSELISAL